MSTRTVRTVELTEAVRFVRPLGKEAEAHVLRFYADNPAATVAALSSTVGGRRLVGSQPHGVEERVGQARGSQSGPG